MSRIRDALARRRRRVQVHRLNVGRARRRLDADPALLDRLDTTVHPGDAMHTGDSAHYLHVGLSAVRSIEAAGVRDARAILDLPCGHGRVLRALAARFPGALLTAADVDRDGVDFCAAQFRATAVYAPEDPRELRLPERAFDLIWCGSLVTHLDEDATKALLGRLADAVAPGGTLFVTTHGALVADRLASGGADYQLDPAGVAGVLDGWREGGFGYAGYPWSPRYGVTLTSEAWMRANAPLPVARFAAHEWDDHQDVYALRRDP